MSAGCKRPQSCLETDNVDSVGVTEYNKDIAYTFRWNIKNFKERLQSDEDDITWSPVFKNFSDDETKRLQWQLRLQRTKYKSEDYFHAYLYLVNYEKATKVALQFDLLNSKKSIKTVTEDREFTSSTDCCLLFQFVKTATLLDPKNKLLKDDTLKINCRITIQCINQLDKSKKVMDAKAKYEKYAAISKNYIASDTTNLFNSSTLSDVSIKTKSTTLKAHKIILSSRSPVFSDMFQNKMTESINSTVEILDFDHDVVNAMLKYIYGGEISEDFLSAHSRAVCKIAANYGIKGLREDAGEYIARSLSLENVVKLLILADEDEVSNLKARAITFFNMNKAQLMKNVETQKILENKPSLLLELYQQTY